MFSLGWNVDPDMNGDPDVLHDGCCIDVCAIPPKDYLPVLGVLVFVKDHIMCVRKSIMCLANNRRYPEQITNSCQSTNGLVIRFVKDEPQLFPLPCPIIRETELEKKRKFKAIMKWKTKKELEEVKSKDGVIRRNLDRILVSATTPLPSNPSRHSQVSLAEKFLEEFTSPEKDR